MRWIRTRLDAFAAALALGSSGLLAAPLGCSDSLRAPVPAAHPDDAPPRRGGMLHLAFLNDMRNLDPAGPPDGLGKQASLLLFDGLVDYDRDGKLVPSLADRWEVEDGGRTYRFALHPGVTMHDGEELTADDVKRSIERALAPGAPNGFASYFDALAGFADFSAGRAPHLAGVVVEGRYVVTFHLARPDAAFLALLALPTARPVCKTAGARYRDDWLPCGAGPFRLEPGGWQRGTSLRLVRHGGYFRPGLPWLDAVEWTFGMQSLPQRLRFEEGSLDLLWNPTLADYARFQADARWRGLGVAMFDTIAWGEAMNTRVPPFDRVEVRRAVAAAVDRSQYAALDPIKVSPLTQAVPRGVPGYDASVTGQVHDEAAALEHMRRAGLAYDPATGRGGWPRSIPYTVFGQGVNTSAAQILQQQLARIGLRIELRLMSWPAYLAVTGRAGGAAMSPQGWSPDYPDPSAIFEPLFTTAFIDEEDSQNRSFYSNRRYDDLVARARGEMDPAVRRSLYHEADEILCDQAPWAFTFAQHDFVMRQPYVRGFAAHPVWGLDVRRVWLDRADSAARHVLSGGLGRGAGQ